MIDLSFNDENSSAQIKDDKGIIASFRRRDAESAEDFKFNVKKVFACLSPKRFIVLIEFNTDGSPRDIWTETDIEVAVSGALKDMGCFDITKLEVSHVEGDGRG